MEIFSGSKREKNFQSGLFGRIYEELLVVCLEEDGYEVLAGKRKHIDADLKRPVVCGYQFDYLLKDSESRLLVAESKCWPRYDKKSVTADPEWINKTRKMKEEKKFDFFLEYNAQEHPCIVDKKEYSPIEGKILLWWDVLSKEEVYWKEQGVIVLSIQKLLQQGPASPKFTELINTYKQWSDDLFRNLLGGNNSTAQECQ